VPAQFGYNRRLVRYADVLLMAAEALNKNGKPDDALDYLNAVRARARGTNPAILPDITETNTDALNEIILHERRVELALEGLRFWDLIRTNKATTVLAPYGYRADKHNLLAIPQTEADLNGWLNNPNW
jgi:starch-binding outer membrane protein, SusD/RagB family